MLRCCTDWLNKVKWFSGRIIFTTISFLLISFMEKSMAPRSLHNSKVCMLFVLCNNMFIYFCHTILFHSILFFKKLRKDHSYNKFSVHHAWCTRRLNKVLLRSRPQKPRTCVRVCVKEDLSFPWSQTVGVLLIYPLGMQHAVNMCWSRCLFCISDATDFALGLSPFLRPCGFEQSKWNFFRTFWQYEWILLVSADMANDLWP